MAQDLPHIASLKIAFTGPESSGKSSLSQAVATYFDGQWHPEYARSYLLDRKGVYDYEDIEQIAIEQEAARKLMSGTSLQCYDTEALVLYIWSTFKYQKCSKFVIALLENQYFNHYILCDPTDVPWEYDPLREHPYQRQELFELYLQKMQSMSLPFTVVRGNPGQRLQTVIDIIQNLRRH